MKNRTTRPAGARAARVLAFGCGLALVAGVSAHDEDWRKLADRLPPVEGEIWRQGDRVLRDGVFDAVGVTCLAQLPINTFGLNSTAGNDCWGYTAPSGKEIAIMGLSNGFGFVDIDDPANPVIIGTIPGPESIWHDVKTIGTYAYGVSDSSGVGVQVMDLSDVDNGNVTLVRNFTNGGQWFTAHNIISNPEAGTLYICGADIGNGGLVHLDLTDPTRPTPDGGWTEMYVHDAQVVTWDSGPYAGREIAFVAGGLSGGFTSTGMRIVDITDKQNPVTLATVFYANSSYAHQVWLSGDRTRIYLNDEIDEQDGSVPTTTTRVINVQDLENPFLETTYTTGLPAADHNLYTLGPYIFQSNYRSGLRIFDGTDPAAPVEVAYFDTFPGSDSDAFNGAWSSYPYFPSGTVIVSDIERGLFVLRPDGIDLTFLQLSLDGAAPQTLAPEGGQTLSVEVEEFNATVASATLVFDDGTGAQSIPGTAGGSPGVFDFAFPAADCGTTASYYISVVSNEGETYTLPAGAPAETFSADVVDSINTLFAEDFQSAPGWAVSGPVTGQGAGEWELGVPAGDGSRGDAPNDFDGSGNCYLTGNGGPGSNTDVDGGATILTSPALDASASPDAMISYARWYDNTGSGLGGNPSVETMEVEISGNNGASWVALETVGPADAQSSGGWFVASFRVADFVTPSDQVRLRFTVSDDIGAVIEAAVDAIEITAPACNEPPACAADLNGDGAATPDDINAFVSAFTDGIPGNADIDGDGDEDPGDINAFVAAFIAGC